MLLLNSVNEVVFALDKICLHLKCHHTQSDRSDMALNMSAKLLDVFLLEHPLTLSEDIAPSVTRSSWPQ